MEETELRALTFSPKIYRQTLYTKNEQICDPGSSFKSQVIINISPVDNKRLSAKQEAHKTRTNKFENWINPFCVKMAE